MKYFFDTEFIEGKQKTLFRETKPTIDLISIGIVDENGREFYAISNEFNLKEAWNRFQTKKHTRHQTDMSRLPDTKEYWIRDNVLLPIFKELVHKETNGLFLNKNTHFIYSNFKRLIKKYGKSNKKIAEDVLYFCSNGYFDKTGFDLNKAKEYELYDNFKPEFYAYFADYDWVVFCWLFGTMMQLPSGFPMYCKDLKQISDDKYEILLRKETTTPKIKDLPNYPHKTNEHNALSDAKWNKELFLFLKSVGENY